MLENIRKEFPALQNVYKNKPWVYFDNAATTQKPSCVINKIEELYKFSNSNIHRGIHFVAEKATREYEETRDLVKEFINAKSRNEIVFTKGTTDSINIIANSLADGFLEEGDEIILTMMEHHSNIVPWQIVARKNKLKINFLNINELGELKIEELEQLLTSQTKLIAFNWVSNTLGTINPVKQIVSFAKKHDILTIVDAAQATQHIKVDVQDCGMDFLCFSGHKLYGPTGTGVLYGKEELLNKMNPVFGGGEMVITVTKSSFIPQLAPLRFEAGTPNFIDVIALGEAIKFINGISIESISKYENELTKYFNSKLQEIPEIRIYGNSRNKSPIFSFLLNNIHHEDFARVIDKEGFAIRSGINCTEPLLNEIFGIKGVDRASLCYYNTFEEIDRFFETTKKIFNIFFKTRN